VTALLAEGYDLNPTPRPRTTATGKLNAAIRAGGVEIEEELVPTELLAHFSKE
jgi:hypothetical protein